VSMTVLPHVSRRDGNLVSRDDVTLTVGPGVTGLLGPNGAGKSTLLHMMSGFLSASAGTVQVDGQGVWHNHEIYRRLGLVPERETLYAYLSGREYVLASARLHRLLDPEEATRRALSMVELEDAQDRKIDTYSKGMRQAAKVT